MLTALATPALADPPKLVSTSPVFWAVGVDPSQQKTVSLTFDQRMSPAYTAWLGRSSISPPEFNPNSSMSEDRRTFSVKVGLQPGKVYVLGLNEKNIPGVGFQNEKGLTLVPHFLVFQTAGAPKAEDAAPSVVRSVPADGDQQVDSARIRGITLIFDQSMETKKHGLHLFENNSAVNLSKIPFAYGADGRTFTLSYNFKRATQYRLELNNTNDIGFARATKIPLWPSKISFSTQ